LIEHFTILVLTYTVGSYDLQSKTLFPSMKECGDALSAYYKPIYAFDKDSMGQCIETDVMSKSIRPKLRPKSMENK